MKVEGNHLAISAKKNLFGKTIHLKHRKMQRLRPNKNVVVTVISPRFLLSLNIEEGKNNAIYTF